MNITNDVKYVGVNDHDIDLFEGQYIVPDGIEEIDGYAFYNTHFDFSQVRMTNLYLTNLINKIPYHSLQKKVFLFLLNIIDICDTFTQSLQQTMRIIKKYWK